MGTHAPHTKSRARTRTHTAVAAVQVNAIRWRLTVTARYEQLDTSLETIEQYLRPAVCERRQTDIDKDNYSIDGLNAGSDIYRIPSAGTPL